MIISKHATSQEAWEYINEFLVLNEEEVLANGGNRYGSQIISYDHFMEINKAWVDPNFNFATLFGYTKHKWSKLVNNYVNFNYLDLVKSEVLLKEKNKAANYNIAYKFDNTHGNGKGCLLSLVFQRRITQDNPLVIFTLRSSEVTKRLIFDFLLIQRIAEYVYGEEVSVSVKLYCANMYLSGETFTMYDSYKPLKKLLRKSTTVMSKRVLAAMDKFLNIDPDKVVYKIHRRAVRQLQKDDDGNAISGAIDLFAKDCKFIKQ